MSESADRSRDATASEWFTLMTRPSVTPEDLSAFRAWRRDPDNAAAFARVKAGWEAAGGLAERPGIVAATEAALAKYPARGDGAGARPSRRFLLRPLAWGAAGLALAGGGAVFALRGRGETFSTGVGGQRLEVLADGTRMRLNTDTRVRVAFGGGARRVVLERGQAFFEVAHDAARPFVVEADGARVRALGTRFDVRRDDGEVRVTLLQGRVEVTGEAGGAAVLTPGEAVVAGRSGVSQPRAVDAPAATSWRSGRITLSGVPLAEAVAEVNRYSERKVVLDAPAAVAGKRISGQFVAGDIDSFVAGARSLYGLKVVSQSPREIRLAPG
jgi:transmembrane sensor